MKTEQEIKNMIKKMEILKLECIKNGNFKMFSAVDDMINILQWVIELELDSSFLKYLNSIESININK